MSLRAAALVALVAGAAGSSAMTLYAGRHSHAPLAVVLIAAWTLTPFVALALADAASARWPPSLRRTLWGVTLIVAAGSLAAYASVAFRARPSTPVFVLVAPASWMVIAAALAFRWRSDRRVPPAP